jgi:two-component system response regulator HydG
MARILIVEDETIIRSALRRLLEHQGYRIEEADTVDSALMVLENIKPDMIITDVRLPGRPGSDLLSLTRNIPILIMTSYASLRSAVDSMKQGAVEYIAKPFDHDEMIQAVKTVLDKYAGTREKTAPVLTAHASTRTDTDIPAPSTFMYGECPEMKRLFSLIEKVAPTDSTVLIQGESGTGKELAAKALHQLSKRRDAPLICVNCAAIPETLIESELFGHEKGAFTGAMATRNGLIEAADGGTLFLDEIGELPLEAQARLLRVLQEGEIRRVGSTQSRKVDVRLIAATHRNLRTMAKAGEFREDLFYRLNVMPLKIPALRERGADIVGLAHKLLERICIQMAKPPLTFDGESLRLILQHSWPGNVRELENCIERAVILEDSGVITPELLGIDSDSSSAIDVAGSEQYMAQPADLSLEDYFQHFVIENQDTMSETELAKKLGISRKSLWERRQRLGIPRPRKSAR